MEVQEYTNKMKRVYNSLLEYLDCTIDEREASYNNLLFLINEEKILDNLDEILRLINKMSKNHYRGPDFFDKIDTFLIYFEDNIKKSFTNLQIFDFFKNNRRILLTLFKRKIIEIDQTILSLLIDSHKNKYRSYKYYFFNEIKDKIDPELKKSIENELLKIDPNIFDDFHEKCIAGENESIICSLIRNDSVEDFIAYMNQNNILNSKRIKTSIFETNSMLIREEPTLIEYSAFYGSIQIFQYLKFNNVELTPSLWDYSIHGRNPEIIHLLEENHVEPISYNNLLISSIKHHHNEFANYISDVYIDNNYIDTDHASNDNTATLQTDQNLFSKLFKKLKEKFFTQKVVEKTNEDNNNDADNNNNEDDINEYNKEIYKFAIRYHNYELFPTNINENNIKLLILPLIEYKYNKFVKLLLINQVINANEKYVIKSMFFNEISINFFFI